MFQESARRAVVIIAGVLSLLTAGCEAPQDGADGGEQGPAMWRITDKDSELVLFGTFHLLPADTDWQTRAFHQAMETTGNTVLEADVESVEAQAVMMALIRKYGMNPPDVTLSERLGPERAARFRTFAERYGVPMAVLEKLRPWLALLTVSQAAYAKAGFDPSSGAETVVLARARKEGDRIDYLESVEIQIRALASLDESEMLKSLDVSLEEFDDFDESMKIMLEAWRSGDLKTLEREIIAEMRKEAPGAYDIIFVQRNREWVDRIREIMAGEGSHFVAVGAGHMVGEDSVIDMLDEAGFKPERIQ